MLYGSGAAAAPLIDMTLTRLLTSSEAWNWLVYIAAPGVLLITAAALWCLISGLAGVFRFHSLGKP